LKKTSASNNKKSPPLTMISSAVENGGLEPHTIKVPIDSQSKVSPWHFVPLDHREIYYNTIIQKNKNISTFVKMFLLVPIGYGVHLDCESIYRIAEILFLVNIFVF